MLFRQFESPKTIRVELVLKSAEEMYRRRGPDVAEIYSQPRVAVEASMRKYGNRSICPGWSLDLTMMDPVDGNPWDLSKTRKVDRLFELIDNTTPYTLIGSPPSTAYSALQYLNEGRRDPEIVKAEKKAAREHIRTCCKAYERQYHNHRYFVHEHPLTAGSWNLPEIVAISRLEGVQCIRVDMCEYGMRGTDRYGRDGEVMKPTMLMTNSPEIARMMAARCANHRNVVSEGEQKKPHVHVLLVGGRAKQAQVYPKRFCQRMC